MVVSCHRMPISLNFFSCPVTCFHAIVLVFLGLTEGHVKDSFALHWGTEKHCPTRAMALTRRNDALASTWVCFFDTSSRIVLRSVLASFLAFVLPSSPDVCSDMFFGIYLRKCAPA